MAVKTTTQFPSTRVVDTISQFEIRALSLSQENFELYDDALQQDCTLRDGIGRIAKVRLIILGHLDPDRGCQRALFFAR